MGSNYLKDKKLLILAGAEVHCKIVRAAKELGVYTIVTDNLSLSEAPAKQIADEYWMIDIMDTDKIIHKAKDNKVDGVLAFCIDPAQLPYQKIASELGLPCYGTKEQFITFTNKREFREYCIKHDIKVVPSYSFEQVKSGKIDFPLLVKPAESRGSRGQTVCHNIEDLKKGIIKAQNESKDGNYIIERYMNKARDMSFSYIIINSEPYLLKIGDRFLGNKKDNLDRQHIATILPSVNTDEYILKIEPKVKAMIKSLGMEFGAVFLQGFWEDGEIYFYDPGLRFPGSDFDIALKDSSGFDNMSTFVTYALTGDPSVSYGNPQEVYKLGGSNCLILSICGRPGNIHKIKGFNILKSDKRIISAELRYHEGETIPDTGDIKQRIAEFIALLPKGKENINNFLSFVYNTLKFEDNKGNNMIISRFNY